MSCSMCRKSVGVSHLDRATRANPMPYAQSPETVGRCIRYSRAGCALSCGEAGRAHEQRDACRLNLTEPETLNREGACAERQVQTLTHRYTDPHIHRPTETKKHTLKILQHSVHNFALVVDTETHTD